MLLNHQCKFVPTYTARLVWGQGDGSGLKAVDVSAGRIGGLICWEHWMPLARQVLHDSGEHLHIAVWHTVHEKIAEETKVSLAFGVRDDVEEYLSKHKQHSETRSKGAPANRRSFDSCEYDLSGSWLYQGLIVQLPPRQ